MAKHDYDLVVLGSGPAGEKGAAQAAYFGKKVALVEKERELGGAARLGGSQPACDAFGRRGGDDRWQLVPLLSGAERQSSPVSASGNRANKLSSTLSAM